MRGDEFRVGEHELAALHARMAVLQVVGREAVGRRRVEPGRDDLRQVGRVAHHARKMDRRKPCALHPFLRLVQTALRRRRAAVLAHEPVGVVDREEDLPVLEIVERTPEIRLDAVGHRRAPFVRRMRKPPVVFLVVGRVALVGRAADRRTKDVRPVMVGPHEREPHALRVRRLQEALFQRLVLDGLAVRPVPVVDEHVDAGVGGVVDLLRDIRRPCVVKIAVARHDRLLMAGEAHGCRLHEVPFRAALAEDLLALRIDVPFGVVDAEDVRPLRRRTGGTEERGHDQELDWLFHDACIVA